jgi:uncharacterized protein YbjT (DUF2867 family)
MSPHAPILVIGGTRGTGLLIAQLLHRQDHRVRVLARNPARALTLLDQGVQLVEGDITKPETLRPALDGARHIIFTAGCRSGHPVREPRVKAVEYGGVVHTLTAARQCGFTGRFLYMNSSGISTSSFFATCLNLWKGNTLVWRRRVEKEIRASGLEYTIIRTGILLNRPRGQHCITVTQQPLPLSVRYRIARMDVAEVFVAALKHPGTVHTTFETVWRERGRPQTSNELFNHLKPDAVIGANELRQAFPASNRKAGR